MSMPLIELSEAEARHLIASKDAGYWEVSLRDSISKSPIPHPNRMAIHVKGRWYLVGTKQLKVEAHGRIGDKDLNAAVHTIQITDPELEQMIRQEVATLGRTL